MQCNCNDKVEAARKARKPCRIPPILQRHRTYHEPSPALCRPGETEGRFAKRNNFKVHVEACTAPPAAAATPALRPEDDDVVMSEEAAEVPSPFAALDSGLDSGDDSSTSNLEEDGSDGGSAIELDASGPAPAAAPPVFFPSTPAVQPLPLSTPTPVPTATAPPSPVRNAPTYIFQPDALDYDTGPLKPHKLALNRDARCLVCYECHAVVALKSLASHTKAALAAHSSPSTLTDKARLFAEHLLDTLGGCDAANLAHLPESSELLPLPGVGVVEAHACTSCGHVYKRRTPCPACPGGSSAKQRCMAQLVPGPSTSPVLVRVPAERAAPPPAPGPSLAFGPLVADVRNAVAEAAKAGGESILGHISPLTIPPFEALDWTVLVSGLRSEVRWMVQPPTSSDANTWLGELRLHVRSAFMLLNGFVSSLPPSVRDRLVEHDKPSRNGVYTSRWKPLSQETSRLHYADAATLLVHFALRVASLSAQHPLRAKVTVTSTLEAAARAVVSAMGTPMPPLPLAADEDVAFVPQDADGDDEDDDPIHLEDGCETVDTGDGDAADDPAAAGAFEYLHPQRATQPGATSVVHAVVNLLEQLFLTGVDLDLQQAPYDERSCGDVASAFVVFAQLVKADSTRAAQQVAAFGPVARTTPLIAKVKYIARLAIASAVRRRRADQVGLVEFGTALGSVAAVTLSERVPGAFHTLTHWSRFFTACLSHELPFARFSTTGSDVLKVQFDKYSLDFGAAARQALVAAADLEARVKGRLLCGVQLDGRVRAIDDVFDNFANLELGYSAALDNGCVEGGLDAIMDDLVPHWTIDGTEHLSVAALDRFLAEVDEVTQELMPLAYFAAAGAYRVTEFLSIGLANLVGTSRGVLYRRSRIQLVPWYSKNLQKGMRGSPIPRPLPKFLAHLVHVFVAVVKPLAARVAVLAAREHAHEAAEARRYTTLAQGHMQALWVVPSSKALVDVDRARRILSRGLGALFGRDSLPCSAFRQSLIGVLRLVLAAQGSLRNADKLLQLDVEEGADPGATSTAGSSGGRLVVDQMAGHSSRVADLHYAVRDDEHLQTLWRGSSTTITSLDWDCVEDISERYFHALGWDVFPSREVRVLDSAATTTAAAEAATASPPRAHPGLDALEHIQSQGGRTYDLVARVADAQEHRLDELARLVSLQLDLARGRAALGQASPPLSARAFLSFPVIDTAAPLAALRKVYGADATWHTETQANLVALLCADVTFTLQSPVRALVERTGAGKTNAVLIPSLVHPRRLVVFVVSTVALRASVRAALQRAVRSFQGALHPDAHVREWSSTTSSAAEGIVLVSPEHAEVRAFASWCTQVASRASTRGDVHVVIDEPQLVFAHHAFRPQLAQLGALLAPLGVPTTYLSATIPPQLEPVLLAFGTGGRPVEVFRSETTRRDLHVVVLRASLSSKDERARFVCAVQQVAFAGFAPGSVRGIVYLPTQQLVEEVASAFHALADAADERAPPPSSMYHGGIEVKDRTAAERAWATGTASPVMFCTPHSFGTGVDRPDVRFTIHLLTEVESLVNFAQEIGRAARGPQVPRGLCVVVPPPQHGSAARSAPLGDEDVHEHRRLLDDSTTCRLSVLAHWLDGRPLHYPPLCVSKPDTAECDLCHARSPAAAHDDSSEVLDALLGLATNLSRVAPLPSRKRPHALVSGSGSGSPALAAAAVPPVALAQAGAAQQAQHLHRFALSTEALCSKVRALVPDFPLGSPRPACLPCALVGRSYAHTIASRDCVWQKQPGDACKPASWMSIALMQFKTGRCTACHGPAHVDPGERECPQVPLVTQLAWFVYTAPVAAAKRDSALSSLPPIALRSQEWPNEVLRALAALALVVPLPDSGGSAPASKPKDRALAFAAALRHQQQFSKVCAAPVPLDQGTSRPLAVVDFVAAFALGGLSSARLAV
ncbi:hypothetical protein Rhopal_005318-T1 [Rhodotorula paludigena]|uniref:DNA 3'-5' helicase n=1 Tax=Rhodotorula paludigena TaxID=86838 RepID=A0AAV5GUL7_9BASI|nr:hypothetical protein Rhopal_005318-T1 [Rhodotorula paludigena]